MRFSYTISVTTVAILASGEIVVPSVNSEETKLVVLAQASNITDQNVVAGKRLLRDDGARHGNLSAQEEDRSFLKNTQFLYWYMMGRTPQSVYKKYFEGMDRSIVVNNPNYAVWKRYEDYYKKKTSA
ncbi:secreted RxLR effector peptide protein, putative [Phytophthora infestans T30-4]